jgi:hypothetical protein
MRLEPSLLVQGTKYGPAGQEARRPSQRVQTPGQRAPGAPSQIFIPKMGKEIPFAEWYWRELREGGALDWYLRAEKGESVRRLRATARRQHGFEQNRKSDWRLLAAIPGREFLRWQKEDPDFWADDKNLRSFKRDNPDACVYV